VKSLPAEDIVKFLSFSEQSGEAANAIEKFRPRDWNRVQQWMQDAGLTFFFLQRLIETNATRIVPPAVMSRLQRNFALNQTRTVDLSRRFQSINKRFDNLGVLYVVMKGFSLIPEFCPTAALRHQSDLDYLIDPQSLTDARRVLIDSGYEPQQSVSAKEFIFVSPGTRASRNELQYSPQAGHAVELHTDVWDHEMHGFPPIPQFFRVDHARRRHWNDLAFFALSDEEAFLLQVLHACRHLFTQWIRVSCLFEIGYFLRRRASDANLWSAVERRVQNNALVREFVVIVSELVSQLFASPLPPLIQDWAAGIRPSSRLWIENYGRSWAFCELPVHELSLFPRSKLVLFLQQQYKAEPVADAPNRHNAANHSHVSKSEGRKPSWLPRAGWLKRKRLLRRGVYYALAQVRYLCEIPRWRWINRSAASTPKDIYLAASKKAS
jgi:hypothetical protein